MKLLLEIGPLFIFFVTYKYSGMIAATSAIIVASLIAVIVSYILDGSVSKPLLLSTIILFITGLITIFSGDSTFIKMKPTFVYSLFAGLLLVGNYWQKPLLKMAMEQALDMPDLAWMTLSTRFAGFFIIMAILNEIVWRNFAEAMWVNFKVFGALPLTMIFVFAQIPFMMRNSKSSS